MQEHGLGPNGAMLYCMEYLEANMDWLEGELSKIPEETWVIFDCAGQVELSTNHGSLKKIIDRLGKIGFRVRSSLNLPSGRRGRLGLICDSWLQSIFATHTM